MKRLIAAAILTIAFALPATAQGTAQPFEPATTTQNVLMHGLAGSYMALGLVDLRQTTLALSVSGFQEGNSVPLWILENTGMTGFQVFKIAATIGITAVLELVYLKWSNNSRDRWFVITAIGAAVAVQAFVVESNSRVTITGESLFDDHTMFAFRF